MSINTGRLRILGIDPGTGRTGWGVIDVPLPTVAQKITAVGYGCFATPKESPMGDRLVLLQDLLIGVVNRFKPDHIVVEQLFFGANSLTAMSVGQARGVVLLTAARHKLTFFEYQGLSVKRELTGNGRADKRQVQEKMRDFLVLSELPRPDDAADALAVAVCHAIKKGLLSKQV